jgi:vesicle-associated membrane protein 7
LDGQVLYSLVVKEWSTILVEADSGLVGNYKDVTAKLFPRIRRQVADAASSDGDGAQIGGRYAFEVGAYRYIVLVEGPFAFLGIARPALPLRIAFGFLAELRERFLARPEVHEPAADGYARAFENVMRSLMRTWADGDRYRKAQAYAETIREELVQCVELMLDRGERVELLLERAENVSAGAADFRLQTRELKRDMWWKNARWALVVGVLIVAVAAAALFVSDNRRDGPSPAPSPR